MDKNIGRKFNKLTIIQFDHKDKNRKSYYLCKCDCGKTKVISLNNLITGSIKSCGCIKVAMLKSKSKKYSKNTHPKLYNTWSAMKQRCYNKKASNYYKYGDRGITVCIEWKNSFENFAKWALNNNYKEGLSIDRINVNGNYEPSNCRWATIKQQSINKRRTIFITYKGENLTINELAKKLGQSYQDTYRKYKKGKYNETNIPI